LYIWIIAPTRRCPVDLVAPRSLLLVLALLFTGCSAPGERAPNPEAAFQRVLESPVDTVVSTESGLLASAADLGLTRDGTLLVLDAGSHALHVIAPDGRHLRTVGRMGAGPGEFSSPSSLAVQGDTILVVDSRNARLQRMALDGTPLDSRPLPPGYPPAVAAAGWGVVPTLGRDSILARIHSADGTPGPGIGEISGTFSGMIRLSELKEEIQEGGVPTIFMNTVTTRTVGDSTVWLLVPARGLVERYGLSGERHAALTLDDPGFDGVRTDFFERNAVAEPMALVPLDLILDARPVDDHLWVLLGRPQGEGARIAVVSPTGKVEGVLDVPGVVGARQFLPDPERGWIWFVVQETAEILRIPLEEWPGGG
jgi:hypothetical protein